MQGVLLQIFMQPVGDRPTVFLEVSAITLMRTIFHYDMFARHDMIIESACLWPEDAYSIQFMFLEVIQRIGCRRLLEGTAAQAITGSPDSPVLAQAGTVFTHGFKVLGLGTSRSGS